MRDPDEAKEYVRSEYREMFGQMKDLGLNTTFAPNCDVNFYKDDPGYKQYISYKAYWAKDKNEINPEEKDDYEAALLFKAYLQKTATYEKLKKHPDLESSDQLKIAVSYACRNMLQVTEDHSRIHTVMSRPPMQLGRI